MDVLRHKSTVCVMAVLMGTYYLHCKISRQNELILKTQRELQHKTLMEKHNDELLKIEADMRAWRHDFHNHLQSMLVLSRKGVAKELEQYILSLGQQLSEVEGICHTGQQALDAIVSVKYALAKADGIKINLQMAPIAPIPINDVDVTSLFGNLFDNAIESCRRVDTKKRSIDLILEMIESMICIRMTNTTDGTDHIENGQFFTTKPDERLHGFGIAAIDRIIAAAGGVVQREHKNCLFTTVLLIPMKM